MRSVLPCSHTHSLSSMLVRSLVCSFFFAWQAQEENQKRIVLNENGQYMCVGKRKKIEGILIQISIVTSNVMWCDVMIAILCLLTSRSLKRSEEEGEKRRNWAGHHAICMEYGKRKERRKKYKLYYSFPPFLYCYQLLSGKQTDVTWNDDDNNDWSSRFPIDHYLDKYIHKRENSHLIVFEQYIYSKQEATEIYKLIIRLRPLCDPYANHSMGRACTQFLFCLCTLARHSSDCSLLCLFHSLFLF